MAVRSAIVGLVVRLPPLQNDAPCNSFQDQGNATQDADRDDVACLPLLLNVQDGHAFEDVDDAQYDDSVTDRVVIHVPVDAVFVILLWPQEECKDLNGKKNVEKKLLAISLGH